jgi:hypothetical protein
MGLPVFSGCRPIQLWEGGLAGSDAVEEVSPARPAVLLTAQPRPGAQRPRGIRPEVLCHGRRAELSIGLLGEHADTGQRTQQSIESRRVRARGLSQLIYAPWTILQQVGDTEGSAAK